MSFVILYALDNATIGVKWHGIRLWSRLYLKYNQMSTREEAELKEKDPAQKYRMRGYIVWSN